MHYFFRDEIFYGLNDPFEYFIGNSRIEVLFLLENILKALSFVESRDEIEVVVLLVYTDQL